MPPSLEYALCDRVITSTVLFSINAWLIYYRGWSAPGMIQHSVRGAHLHKSITPIAVILRLPVSKQAIQEKKDSWLMHFNITLGSISASAEEFLRNAKQFTNFSHVAPT